MPLILGLKAIDDAFNLGAEWVSLTGGEPFLELELLTNIVEYASGKGLSTEAVTNGFWATSVEVAENILAPLVEKGLDVLNLSIDDFHQEYVPLEYVRNAYQAASKLGIKIVLMTTTVKQSRITSETIPQLLQDERIQVIGAQMIRDPNALLIETPITPVGRGESLTEHDYTLFTEIKCGEALRDIGIRPNGDVYPCCGPLATDKVLGNIHQSSLKSILEEAQRDPFYQKLRNGIDVSGAFTSRCHACLSTKN
jgi:radical SAM protein with 4Fe4S-binding SPASM domain